MDLGECPKIHDIALVADFNNASKNRDYFYDVDVCDSLLNRFLSMFKPLFSLNVCEEANCHLC